MMPKKGDIITCKKCGVKLCQLIVDPALIPTEPISVRHFKFYEHEYIDCELMECYVCGEPFCVKEVE